MENLSHLLDNTLEPNEGLSFFVNVVDKKPKEKKEQSQS